MAARRMAKKLKITKKQLVTGVIALVVIAGAIGFGVVVRMMQQTGSNPNGVQDDVQVGKLPPLISEVQDLQSSGSNEEAEKKINESLANSSTDTETKYMLYIQKGNLRANSGDWQGSIEEYKKALETKETFEATQLIGHSYQQVDNKAEAIAYYKRAIPLVPQDSPMAEREKQILEDTIRYLGGTP